MHAPVMPSAAGSGAGPATAAAGTAPLRLDDLLTAARGRPGPVFFTEEGAGIDASGFEALVAGAVGFLRAQGVGPGDRIALWHVNRLDWLAILFACARIGAAVAVVNTRYRTAELGHILRASGAGLLILAPGFGKIDFLDILAGLDGADLPELSRIALLDADTVSGAVPDRLIGRPVQAARIGVMAPSGADGTSDAGAPLVFFTTSGTTSAPKLVTHCQQSLAFHARACVAAFGFDAPGAGFAATMPYCGVYGLNAQLAALAGGAPSHILPMFEAERTAALIRDNGVTHLFGSDEMFRRLMEIDPGLLDAMVCCGFASFTPGLGPLMEAAAARGVPLRGVYGSSEVCALFAVQDAGLAAEERVKGGGRPAAGQSVVRVRDPESGALLPHGAPGALEFRSPSQFTGYFRNPGATREAVDGDGFFRSGDMGYTRGDGSFVYLARMGDAIRLSGFLTDPAEIEEVLKTAPGVGDAQVVAVVQGGQNRPVAFVIPADGFDAETVLSHARGRLAAFKVPFRVWPVESFPTTDSANGLKVQRARLRDMAEARLKEEAP
ncbi:AMP-binding protein [Acidimangrovimonas sediminis]|uniref:AMP-binding protein n=1 Tax=Acidimangrovimonas sediminis TaxID=2056283 RepID=UPI000C8039BA|nr:AMP-binding protein [Acidimangrovimonas sediminis]